MSAPIRTVALAGASGNLGPAILAQLLEAKYIVTVLTREGSKSTFPPFVNVVPVDYDSVDSLAAALKGQDALVATLASVALDVQIRLVDAAVIAGVKRFIPSEFGSYNRNALARQLPVYAEKLKVQEYLETKAKESGMTYTYVFNGAFFDWGLKVGFLLSKDFYDGGDRPFSVTTLSTIGMAVVGVLKHPEETKDRGVFVHDAVVTQRQLARVADKVTGRKDWESSAESVSTETLEKKAYAELGKEKPDFRTAMVSFIVRAMYAEGYGGKFERVDNEMLGLGLIGDKEIEELVAENLH